MRPGDVLVEEPQHVGVVVVSTVMEAFISTENLTWCMCGRGVGCTKCSWTWGGLAHPVRYAWGLPDELTVISGEQWEPVTAEQVKVGGEVEVTHTYPNGTTVTYRGVVGDGNAYWASLHPRLSIDTSGETHGGPPRNYTVTIRRRVHTLMAEPAGPAIVRHAGCVAVRPACDLSGRRWMCLQDPEDPSRGGYWLEWAEVLALDPTTDPVVIGLDAPTNPTSERSPA